MGSGAGGVEGGGVVLEEERDVGEGWEELGMVRILDDT